MAKDTLFDGFEPANTTPVPDILFDMLLTRLSGAELKVLLYIIRRTWGFKKTTDAISLSQFENGIVTQEGKRLDYGVGLNRETICKALQSLEEKGYIKSHKRTAHKRDKDVTVYSIRFKGEASVVGKSDQAGSRKSGLPDVVGKSDYGSRKSPKKVVGKSDPQETVLQDTVKQETDESNSDDTANPPVVSSDTAHASFEIYGDIVPYTFVEALAYLAPHGGVPPGYGAIEVVKLAQKLYAEAHSQDEQVFTNEKPQGDDHATLPAAGHPHRVGDTAAPGVGHSHRSGHSARLEAKQEIDKGEHHATRVPTLPAANTAASSERAPSRHPQDHSNGATLPADGLPVVRVVGSSTTCRDGNQDTESQRVDGRDATHTLAQTPTTLTPAQSLSPFPQAEQAALGQGKGKGKKQAEPKPETPKSPPVAPPSDMAWGTRKCLMWFDYWRGGILIGKFKLMQASTCAKGLSEQFDEQTVIQARTDMEADPYYIDKGGCDVCDVANNIHKYLKRRQGKQQPAIQPALKVVKRYSSYDDPNFRSDQDFYPVEGGSYAAASR